MSRLIKKKRKKDLGRKWTTVWLHDYILIVLLNPELLIQTSVHTHWKIITDTIAYLMFSNWIYSIVLMMCLVSL